MPINATSPVGPRISEPTTEPLIGPKAPDHRGAIKDRDKWLPEGFRPYFSVRSSPGPKGAFFTNTDAVSEARLKSPSAENFASGAIGADWGKYWGAELSVDFVETFLNNSRGQKVGEYAMWTALAQLRLRYPLLQGKLTPYLLAGAGFGIGEFNDRESGISPVVRGPLDTTFLGAVGGGIDYFIARNIAVGLEAKYRFFFDTEIEVGGQGRELDLDSWVWAAGLRVYFDGEEGSGRGLPAADTDAIRGYLALRVGGLLYTSSNESVGLEVTAPAFPVGSATLGVNLGKYWGVEVAADFVETDFEARGVGIVGEYTIFTATGQVRLRYPVMDDRLTPYLFVGGGMGFGEFNDHKVSPETFAIRSTNELVPLATAGAGIEYFIVDNIAVGVELKHLFLFDTEVATVPPKDINLDSLFLSAGIRIFVP